MAQNELILEVKNMYKNFGATVALNNVSFKLERGHVYGLIGENGSGKSTVSSIIAGMQGATKGEMVYKGQPWKPHSTLEAQENGIGMVVQEAGTIPNISVAENIFLGHERMFSRSVCIKRSDKDKLALLEEKMNKAKAELEEVENASDKKETALKKAQEKYNNASSKYEEFKKEYDNKILSSQKVGEEKRIYSPFVNKGKMLEEAKKLLEEYEIDMFEASTRTSALDMQVRKIIEIVKCLYWNPDILIIDETSTALSLEGREFLYKVMKRQKEENKVVLFISHDLDEMMEQCDKLTVLRDGVIIGTLDQVDYEPNKIRQMMVGREIKGDYYRNDNNGYSDEVVLEADEITTREDLLVFSLQLHKGEILGLGGLSHCGMHTVGRALFGIEKILDGEVIGPDGEIITSPKKAISKKMGYVSKNRDTESLGLSASIYENIASTGYKINRWIRSLPLISFRKEKDYVDEQIKELSIKCASRNHNVNTLSGGNKQKVVFGKWMAPDSQILILDCPTRGVDVGVKASMYKLIYEMKMAGKSIVLISEELQELIGMCDRILILKDGEITAEKFRSEGLTESMLIDYMI